MYVNYTWRCYLYLICDVMVFIFLTTMELQDLDNWVSIFRKTNKHISIAPSTVPINWRSCFPNL